MQSGWLLGEFSKRLLSCLTSSLSLTHMCVNELSPKICVRKLFLMQAISTCANVNFYYFFLPTHSYGIFSFGLIFLVEGYCKQL